MRTKIVKIGNSMCVRIPKSLLDQNGLDTEVELKIENGQIIIKPILRNKDSWGTAFRKMAKNNDDVLMAIASSLSQSEWEREEWEW